MTQLVITPPRRRNPWYRPRNVILTLLFTLMGWIVYLVIWALTVKPNPSIDYAAQLQALSQTSQPPGENGWPLLEQAAQLMQEVEDSFDKSARPVEHERRLDFSVLRRADASTESIEMANQALEQLRRQGAFDKLAEAAQRPNVVRPISPPPGQPLLYALLPELGPLGQLGQAQAASMRAAFAAGDHHEALAACDQTLYVANVCSHQALLINHLVGYSILNNSLDELREAVTQRQVDAATLRELLKIMQRRASPGPVEIGFEGERRAFLDIVQHVHSDNGRGDGTLLLSEAPAVGLAEIVGSPLKGQNEIPAIWNLAGFAFASRRDTTDKGNFCFDNLVRQSRLPRHQRPRNAFDESAYVQQLGRRYSLLRLMLPALGHAIDVADIAQCKTGGTMLMLAIELHGAEHGIYPDSLDTLVPEILPSIPDEPFSARGFVYRLVENDPHGRGYLLYSIGADGKDDGGQAAPEPNNAFNTNRHKSATFDYVFNQPSGEE